MASLTVLKSVAILVLSIGVGFLYFYVMSPDSKEVKRKQIDDTLSMIVNFIIYIWIGKILTNISTFIEDPIAVLAYPSNSKSFYIATILIVIHILYKAKRKNYNVIKLLHQYIPIFLVATFMYEIIQWTVNGQKYNGLLLLFITIILVLFTLKKKSNTKFVISLTFTLLIGFLIISMFSSLMTLFGYMLAPWYFLILCMLLLLIVYSHKRMV